jgi:hypothetical protein
MLATLGLAGIACGSEDASPGRVEGSAAGSGEGQVGGSNGPTDECLDPVFHADSGVEMCSTSSGDTYVHRKEVGTGCNYVPPEPSGVGGARAQRPGGECDEEDCELQECSEDSECSGRYPYCDIDVIGGSRCAEGCLTDDECPSGSICECAGSGPGRCLSAGCATDADCGDRGLCVAAADDCVGYESESTWYACQDAADECLVNSDCSDPHALCEHDVQQGRRQCIVPDGVCGRPLLVAGSARLAHVAVRSDWREEGRLAPDLAALNDDERRQLAQHYTEVALMEHASIAAFARFSLQLVGLGAPPALLADCTRAIDDETRHARQCFELASRYAGFDVGPSALDVGGCLDSWQLRDVLELVIAEGCVGETIAAIEAAEAAAYAVDPAVREVLSQIVDDERRHAELAFRFVAWALQRQPELVPIARRAFAEGARARRHAGPRAAEPSLPRLLAHGLLSDEQRHAIGQRALCDVVEPCAGALLSHARSAAPRSSLHSA